MSLRNVDEGYQARINTSYSVTYPEFPATTLQPYQILLHQEERSHDIAVLKYQIFSNFFFKALKTGTPVTFSWRNSPKNKGVFVGHVVKVKRLKAAQAQQELEIHCVASSFALKQTKNNTWKNKTASDIVKDIGNQTKIKTVITPNSTKFSQISQYGKSYWEFLNELAFKIGYVMYVKDAVLYFQDIDEVIDKQVGSIPLLNFETEFAPPFHSPIERTLDKFEPIVSDLVEDDDQPRKSNKLLSGIDPITAKVYGTKKAPTSSKGLKKAQSEIIFDDNTSFDVTNSKMFADSLAKGKADRARMSMPAKFLSQGDARIRPYGVVEISGIDETTDGYWLVRSVTHTMNKVGHYQCEGVLVTDGRGLKTQPARRTQTGTVPVLNLTNRGNGEKITKNKPPKLSQPQFSFSQSKSGYTQNKRTWKVK
jgi:phage protein D